EIILQKVHKNKNGIPYCFFIVITSVGSNQLCSYGIAKYKLFDQISRTIRWKYFFPSNAIPQVFNLEDIVFISKCVTIAYASIIDTGKPDREFDITGVPICTPHCMISVSVNRNPKKTKEFIHFKVECVAYNSVTGSANIKMKMIALYALQSVRFKHLDTSELNIKIENIYLISEFIKFSDSDIITNDIESVTPNNQFSTIYDNNTASMSDTKVSSMLEKKNYLDLDDENNDKELQSDHNEEKAMLSDEHIKSLDENEEQEVEELSRKRK
ncbi:14188_t:CDS:2, partial [Cetraspora pellucida]